MQQDKVRWFLIFAILFLGMYLHSYWQSEVVIPKARLAAEQRAHEQAASRTALGHDLIAQTHAHDLPVSDAQNGGQQADMPVSPEGAKQATAAKTNKALAIPANRLIHVDTDLMHIAIDKKGGDIVRLSLKKYPKTQGQPDIGYQALDTSEERFYISQSGLLGQAGPDSPKLGRADYRVEQQSFKFNGSDALKVPLYWTNKQGVKVTKIYVFHKNSYLIDVGYHVNNQSSQAWEGRMYGQIKRQYAKSKKGSMFATRTYTGAAVFTPEKPYKKLKFDKFEKDKFTQTIDGGWAAMREHYFLAAWLPQKEDKNFYYTKVDNENMYTIGAMGSQVKVQPRAEQNFSAQLYVGPEDTETLKEISPGLNLTVDYGFLWPISHLLFWVMDHIHSVVGNWGLAIIFVTVFIKLIFFKLSAASYRSMGNMRKLQPKMEQLKRQYGDDRQGLSQAMIGMYKKEKINPLGGCLPILVQIPVFIALYYVLLESVELRQAPFMLWITDLAAKDPYYVLPLLMGASMLIQQRLNPSPPDPIQAKIMMMMPIVFTALFLSFPAGLVLYWVVNNTLSILQQWVITRKIEQSAIPVKA